MYRVSFKCPECNTSVSIEGTSNKVCPLCGYRENLTDIQPKQGSFPKVAVRRSFFKTLGVFLKDLIS